ncbi:class I SAM-dependent methyltransferase [Streptomyces sp. SP17BM10]|uniref:class I SAM-dependent methyltransferase n=1 Tax=Streptomyces sp. SP17BM10 TaxID=3002530 RepID=UPI002E75BF19|nr:class I SAM-dependent methyltransferase [Streptomyces sp. SP17BM10]MEE1782429.1 class I SAM-dependent methyltransferase [Streptomyces sp. SP17BM10]
MTTDTTTGRPGAANEQDELAKGQWNDAYRLDDGHTNLWGDPPVPYVVNAAKLFADHDAFVVLDLPCGDGRNLPPLAQAATVVLGGDTSRNAMGIARRVVAKANADNVVFKVTDAFATGLPDDSVDGIFCWDLLGHLTEPVKALQELYRICRPGGHVVANMWTMNDCQVGDPGMKEIRPKEYLDHADFYCRFFDRPDLDAYLADAGFADEVAAVELLRWMEPPHAGYRPYFHEHESLAFTIRKKGR